MVHPGNVSVRPVYQFTFAGMLSHNSRIRLALLREVLERVKKRRDRHSDRAEAMARLGPGAVYYGWTAQRYEDAIAEVGNTIKVIDALIKREEEMR